MMHNGSAGYLKDSAPSRRLREAYFFANLTLDTNSKTFGKSPKWITKSPKIIALYSSAEIYLGN